MGFPVSPIVANLYIKYFELWLSYADDTFVIQKEEHEQHFLEHINSVDLAIMFTVENNKENGAIPFLNTIV